MRKQIFAHYNITFRLHFSTQFHILNVSSLCKSFDFSFFARVGYKSYGWRVTLSKSIGLISSIYKNGRSFLHNWFKKYILYNKVSKFLSRAFYLPKIASFRLDLLLCPHPGILVERRKKWQKFHNICYTM